MAIIQREGKKDPRIDATSATAHPIRFARAKRLKLCSSSLVALGDYFAISIPLSFICNVVESNFCWKLINYSTLTLCVCVCKRRRKLMPHENHTQVDGSPSPSASLTWLHLYNPPPPHLPFQLVAHATYHYVSRCVSK